MVWKLHDDITGEPIADGEGGPVTITLGDERFVVDLSDRQREVLRGLLEPYIAAGRPADSLTATRARGATARPSESPLPDGPSNAEIREWARNAGIAVPRVGRVPADVRKAYLADLGGAASPRTDQPEQLLPAAPAPTRAPTRPLVDATPDRPRPEQVDVVEQMLDDGAALTQIAAESGLSIDQVRAIRSEIGAGR